MRKSCTGLVIALAAMFAVASQPVLAKSGVSSTHHTFKGEHLKEGTITVRKKSQTKPKLKDITVTKPVDKASPK
jgi:type VI protein secretion system component Hcp